MMRAGKKLKKYDAAIGMGAAGAAGAAGGYGYQKHKNNWVK
jgi:hypothetical protein